MAKRSGKTYLLSDIAEDFIKDSPDISKSEALDFLKKAFNSFSNVLGRCGNNDGVMITGSGTWNVKSWTRKDIKLKHWKTKDAIHHEKAVISRVSFIPSTKVKDSINEKAREGK